MKEKSQCKRKEKKSKSSGQILCLTDCEEKSIWNRVKEKASDDRHVVKGDELELIFVQFDQKVGNINQFSLDYY